jgi:nitrite reductase (NADH) large subunit
MTQHTPHATPDVGSALRLTQPTNARQRERLVIAGGGMAAVKLVEELVEQCPGRYEISMAAGELHLPYNRVLLSSLLAGEVRHSDLELKPAAWYAERGVDLLRGVSISGLRPARQEVVLSTGARLGYDRLVLATGSRPIRLPIPGHMLPGVITFRDLADVETLQRARAGACAVVIGGGLLGIEAACGLAGRGLAVTLVHLMPHLMERQLDARAGALLKGAVERKGIEVVVEARTSAIQGNGRAERVLLEDGRVLPAELVVMAAGIRPETALAETGGIEISRGIKVDDKLETNWPGIYAIGECAEHRGVCYGLVEPAYEQAKVLARYLARRPARYDGSLMAASLKVSGVPVYSMGDFDDQGAEPIVLEDEGAGTYRKLVLRGGRLVGVVLFGDTADAFWYRDLIRQTAPVAPMRALLALGKAHAQAA